MTTNVSRQPLTPLSFLERSAHVFADAEAVVDGERRFTYRQLQERVFRLANALRQGGVQPGDRIAVLCPNLPPLLEAHFGVPWAGGVLVAINTRLSPGEIEFILKDAEVRVLIVDVEFLDALRPALERLGPQIKIVTVGEGQAESRGSEPDYERFLQEASPEAMPIPVVDEDALISINYTSGTTGTPKGAMYTHRGAYLNSLGVMHALEMNARSAYLWTLPMFHCNGWCCTWAFAAAGAVSICLRRIDPEHVLRLIEEESVTHLCAAPIVLITLGNHPNAKQLKLSRPLRIATGGSPPSPTTVDTFESMGIEILHLYGLTETYGPNTVCEWQRHWDDTVGEERARLKARQGVEHLTATQFRVVDEALADVPADGQTIGEVVIRGNTVMLGYFGQPETTAEAFAGGWFHSGDLAVVHPDGYMELRDRKKDIIISGGENISTIEVENVLYQHPQVLEVAVVAVPDSLFGEVPKAFVTLRGGATSTQEEMIAFCRERMAHYKAPRHVEFCDLPKTSTGKIQKFLLREREWAGRERRIN
jgi:acyl-CoA synthetase (AMP-forming)/AMP-acid ligase II